MAYFNNNQSSGQFAPAKFGDLFFTRQTGFRNARTHSGILAGLAGWFKTWRAERTASHELFSLSDRELADIGLTRQDIPTVVRIRR